MWLTTPKRCATSPPDRAVTIEGFAATNSVANEIILGAFKRVQALHFILSSFYNFDYTRLVTFLNLDSNWIIYL